MDEAKVNELIAQKIVDLASKRNLAEAVSDKIDANALNSALGGLASAVDGKISTVAAAAVTQSSLNKYVKAQNLSGNTIDFTQGVNFVGQSISGQLTATNITAEQNRGKSGLIYIHGNGVTSLSSDFQIINPDDATYGKGYVFLSYFINPFDNKVIVQFIKKAA